MPQNKAGLLFPLLSVLCLAVSFKEAKADALLNGVVIESATRRSGLREGDVLTDWRCLDGGPLRSPFDLSLDFGERHKCASSIRFRGFRGSIPRDWLITQTQWAADWEEMKIRPRFPRALLARYNTVSSLTTLDKTEKAASVLDEMIASFSEPWVKVWLHLYGSQVFTKKRAWRSAETEFRLAIEDALQAGPSILADAYLQKADFYYERQQWKKATESYRQALGAAKASGAGKIQLANILNGLGAADLKSGSLEAAEDSFKQSLGELSLIKADSSEASTAFANLGSVAWRRGDLETAERYFEQEERIMSRLKPHSIGMANSLGNIGGLLLRRGELVRANRYLTRALEIARKLEPNSIAAGVCLQNLGAVAEEQGNLEGAERLFVDALNVKSSFGVDSLSVATTQSSLAKLLVQKSSLPQAEMYAKQALAIRQRLAPDSLPLAESLSDLAVVLTANRNDEATRELLQRALSIRERLAPGSLPHAETLGALAEMEKDSNNPDLAVNLYERAISALETQVSRLGGSDRISAEYRARHTKLYEGLIDVLLHKNQPQKALETLEGSRANSFRESLVAARINVHQGVDSSLLKREQALREEITQKSDQRIRLLSELHTDTEASKLGYEIADLVTECEQLESEIRHRNPSYAALMKPVSLSTTEIQADLLDRGTVLLEYSLGEKQSRVWVVSSDSVQFFELPNRTVIEKAARELYASVRARGQWVAGETRHQKQVRVNKADAAVPKTSLELSRLVLRPVANLIRGKRLLVVGDGALLYIPFNMLPDPEEMDRNSTDRNSAVPLIASHEIVMLPSASVLAVMRKYPKVSNSSSKMVAVLADPVFARSDARVKGRLSIPNAKASWDSLTRSMSDVGLTSHGILHLPRLAFTREEAEKILATTPAGQGWAALDFDASRATATSRDLANFKIVHFATHGILDSLHPELSGLVLSMVDHDGRSQNGFLGLEDVFNLDLRADLVVLSGCETALGADVRSEGTIGLTRAFMYAGTSRVIASLWKVDDAATAALMSEFYAGLQKKMRPAEALRAAQMVVRDEERWTSPFFWAAFRLEGEWK